MAATVRSINGREDPDATASNFSSIVASYISVVRAHVRSPVRMKVSDVIPLLAQLKDALSELATAGRLGLPLTVLPSLVDRGLIRRLEGPVRGLVPGYRGYTKSSVDELMDKIWSKVRPARDKCHSIA